MEWRVSGGDSGFLGLGLFGSVGLVCDLPSRVYTLRFGLAGWFFVVLCSTGVLGFNSRLVYGWCELVVALVNVGQSAM